VNRSCLFVVAILLSFLVGCASAPLPPRLTPTESERLSELPLSYSVGVAPYKYPVYSDKLAAALKAAGIFSQVSPISNFDRPPDLIANIEERVHGTAVIPALTFATGGVIPTVVKEDHGLVFSLAPSPRKTQKTFVDASYSGTTTLGWLGLAANVLPDYTFSDPDQSERFRRMLGYRTLAALRPRKGVVDSE
jgi:hypothetical protein